MRVVFRIARPSNHPTPLIVEVPHAGTEIPSDVSELLTVGRSDVMGDADLYVDELYRRAPEHGATLIAARFSRYVVDLNRDETDLDVSAVPDHPAARAERPRSLIWSQSTDGHPVLRRPLTLAELETRLDRYYRPYHLALAREIESVRARFGRVILLAAHSMPSVGRARHGDRGRRRADVVPGTRGRTTASPRVIDAVDQHFRAAGLSVRHDDPYRGGATTLHWGRPAQGIHAVQIEFNRALYMDEATHERRTAGFRWLASLCESLLERLALEEP